MPSSLTSRSVRMAAVGALCVSLVAWVPGTEPALGAGPRNGCGIVLLPSLDASGEHLGGEVLDLTHDGIYVGSSEDAAGVHRATYWVAQVAHQVPVDLEDGWIEDVNQQHVAVGAGWDAAAEVYKGYVFDVDTGDLTWLPGIGGDGADARRINEHGVAVGGGNTANGTAFPLRWSPPYASAERLPKAGSNQHHQGAWAAGNNDHGTIVGLGFRGRSTPDRRDYGGVPARYHYDDWDALRWSPGPHSMEEAGPYSLAWDVNNAGIAVGFADFDTLMTAAAAYWTPDNRLHQMGSVIPGMWDSLALGVSEGGWATGIVELEVPDDLEPHAFVWTGTGSLLMMPTLEGPWNAAGSGAHGVDDVRDEVTGELNVGGGSRPTVWRCASAIGVDAS